MRRSSLWPNVFQTSAQTQLIVALAQYGPLTGEELRALMGWKHSENVWLVARRLIRLGVVVRYPWFSAPPYWHVRTRADGSTYRWHNTRHADNAVIFSLDRRHPWFKPIRKLGRALALGFPMPHPEAIKHTSKRAYAGPCDPMHPAPAENLFGDRVMARILMLLAYVYRRGVPIRRLAVLIGASHHGFLLDVRHLESRGVLLSKYVQRERLIQLNPKFCAYFALRELCRLMDRSLTHEYVGLALAYRVQHVREIWQRFARKRRKREAHRLHQREAARRRRHS